MKILGNLLWFIFGGFIMSLYALIAGVACCVSIIFIPFGLQYFKLMRLYFWPFGAKIKSDFGAHPFMNIIWMIFGGLEAALACYIIGGIFFITIIGIPFAKQWFKVGQLTIMPFGADIN